MDAFKPASRRCAGSSSRLGLTRAVQAALRRQRPVLGTIVGLLATSLSAGGVDAAPTAVFPAIFELQNLDPVNGGDGSKGVILRGLIDSESTGRAVSDAGDVNGDGLDDIIVGARGSSRGPSGGAYVLFGTTSGFPALRRLPGLREDHGGDGSKGFYVWGSIEEGALAGDSVSGAGDVNGDGFDDLIIGSPRADAHGLTSTGESYIVFGRAEFPPTLPARSLLPAFGGDGTSGVVLKGAAEEDYAGTVSGAGDINGDGIDDVIVGAANGKSYVVFGRTTGFPATIELRSLAPAHGGDGTEGFVLNDFGSGNVGIAVSNAGDVNADGVDDLIVSATSEGPGGRNGAYVLFGRTTGFPAHVALTRLEPELGGTGHAGFVIREIEEHDSAGYALSAAGDVNGDGIDDLVVGAFRAGSVGRLEAGESYVVFGRAHFPAAVELKVLQPAFGGDGSKGFILRGIDQSDASGSSVSGVGDANGDGIDDLLIGAPNAGGFDDFGHIGEAYVVFGRAAGFPAIVELANLHPANGGDGSKGAILMGYGFNDNTGFAVSGAGDVNGDGIADLLVGEREANDYTRAPGEAYLVFGRSP